MKSNSFHSKKSLIHFISEKHLISSNTVQRESAGNAAAAPAGVWKKKKKRASVRRSVRPRCYSISAMECARKMEK